MKTYGLGFNINKIFSKVFSGNAGYNFSFTDRSIQEFDRHLITIQLTEGLVNYEFISFEIRYASCLHSLHPFSIFVFFIFNFF